MTSAPDWLSEFPFLHTQWPAVAAIKSTYASLNEYDLNQDWLDFEAEFKQAHPTPDPFVLLRQFRKSRLAYIAYQDLSAPLASHLRTMHLVSALADLLLQQAHALASADMQARHGLVKDDEGTTVELMVFALGKLGTGELNYSSDVDLVFLYEHNGISDGGRPLDAASYFVRMGQKIIKLLDHYSADGQVYRVDMRLRPFGSAAPLVCTLSAFHQYLLYEGREWERFAWMRARMVCGPVNLESTVLAKITPFIYRKHLDYGVFQALSRIKTEIAGKLDYQDDDLKQGTGGIRAVEFIVQSLQMVFGGRNPQLQGAAISENIKALAAAGKLTNQDADQLHMAWLWLRKVENVAQLVADQATHQLPESDGVKQVISNSLGFTEWHDSLTNLNKHRKFVATLFQDLFTETDGKDQLTTEQDKLFKSLMAEFPAARMPQDRCEQVEQLLKTTINMAPESVCRSFAALVKKILTRPSYLLMLQKEANVHRLLLKLLAQNPYFEQQLQLYPMLLEQLFEVPNKPLLGLTDLQDHWCKQNKDTDTEAWMEAIRYFKLVHQFNWVKFWSDQVINSQQTGQQLTLLAQFVLTQVVAYSWHEIKQKFSQTQIDVSAMVVVAYGSAAVEQMNVASDLDLVFVLDDKLQHTDDQLFVQKWVKRIINHLTSPMYHGKLYELDMQLRPNGNSGALITTRNQFARYQLHEAWVWEHAAMVKSRVLVGNDQQIKWHENLRQQILSLTRDPVQVDQAMQEMAIKLQQFHGGKAHEDEFQVLGAVLKYSSQHPQLMQVSSLSKLQNLLLDLNLIEKPKVLFSEQKKDPVS